MSKADDSTSSAGNFVRDLIKDHLEAGRYQQVVTRFPPEPNGYLHIGHAKAIQVNFGLAAEFGGRCHLRMDDTNPLTEETEYVDSIKEDIRWLGFDWGECFFFASDYFEQLYDYAVQLIERGKAYVDSLSEAEIRAHRGTVTEPGRASPFRSRSTEENLRLFAEMRAGKHPDSAHVLRAKIDMSHPNMKMRDPLLYRIRHAHHHRTKDAWCIYPMYDYAHCLSDAIEGITHSLCTLEFENNRDIYDWVLDELGFVEPRTHQYEFARLELSYTITSKRKLRKLVEDGLVEGWDDPRMPTLAGVRRRGVPAEAIRTFIERGGVSKSNSVVDIAQLEHVLREHLNEVTPRVMAVLDPLKVVIDNFPAGQVEWLEAPCFPKGHADTSTRKLPFSRELYIEREDFMENPPRKFYRLVPGGEVRLRYGFFIRCEQVIRDSAGEIVELRCSYDPQTRGGTAPAGRKVKATLHWVSAAHALTAQVRLYDRLFSAESPGGDDFIEQLNPDSLTNITDAKLEPSLAQATAGQRFQFERKGYFCVDSKLSEDGAPVFNRIVTLKDAWKRLQKRAEPAKPAKKPRATGKVKKRKLTREQAAAGKPPELAARMGRYIDTHGLSVSDAHLLTDDVALADFFDAALAAHPNPRGAANWINNALAAVLKERSIASLPFGGEAIGALVKLLDAGVISSRSARDVFAHMLQTGDDPALIVEREGLQQLSDPVQIAALIDSVLADHADVVDKYRAGDRRQRGFLIGEVMKASGGQASPQLVNQLLREKLES